MRIRSNKQYCRALVDLINGLEQTKPPKQETLNQINDLKSKLEDVYVALLSKEIDKMIKTRVMKIKDADEFVKFMDNTIKSIRSL